MIVASFAICAGGGDLCLYCDANTFRRAFPRPRSTGIDRLSAIAYRSGVVLTVVLTIVQSAF